jgi:hypothetical protein
MLLILGHDAAAKINRKLEKIWLTCGQINRNFSKTPTSSFWPHKLKLVQNRFLVMLSLGFFKLEGNLHQAAIAHTSSSN